MTNTKILAEEMMNAEELEKVSGGTQSVQSVRDFARFLTIYPAVKLESHFGTMAESESLKHF